MDSRHRYPKGTNSDLASYRFLNLLLKMKTAISRTQKQTGFTLIELMIVVAIIGILAAVGLPAYQDYTKKAKMSEVLLASSTCKHSVTEAYAIGSALPGGYGSGGGSFDMYSGAWGCESSTPLSKYVAAIGVGPQGEIVITVGTGIDPDLADGKTLSLTPYSDDTHQMLYTDIGKPVFKWVCGGTTNVLIPTTVGQKLLPGSCRGTV
jgi:type IV pilus assembly protein PilA